VIAAFMERLPRQTRVLDIGTATGYLGEALRRLGFTRLTGLESDEGAAGSARQFYDAVVQADVESAALPWAPGAFDVIICADVLEHLRDPQAVLRRLKSFLASDGWMIVSVPNVAHWSVRLSLLAGRFDYRPSGILDETHLRFFTRRSIRGLMRQAGMSIGWEAVTPLPIAHWIDGSPWRRPLRVVEYLDWTLARLWPGLFAYQLVVAARPA
jgi:2-polyprenyl-3-methyl-5-hydroxy-6-metoxy-1,4-benzoquinol methylase